MTQHTNSRKKILIADDEAIIRELLSYMLAAMGFTVFTAENGAMALEIFKNNRDIELVLTDVNMPHMSGIELVNEILALDFFVKCIMMTARPDQWEVREFRRTGLLAGFLEKPFGIEELAEAVSAALDMEVKEYAML
jgi:DNA-binding NtrC family response regulator